MPTITIQNPAGGNPAVITLDHTPTQPELEELGKKVQTHWDQAAQMAKLQTEGEAARANPYITTERNRSPIGNISSNTPPSLLRFGEGMVDLAKQIPDALKGAATAMSRGVSAPTPAQMDEDARFFETFNETPEGKAFVNVSGAPALAGEGTMGGNLLDAAQKGTLDQFVKGVPAGIARKTQDDPVGQIANIVALIGAAHGVVGVGKAGIAAAREGLAPIASDIAEKSARGKTLLDYGYTNPNEGALPLNAPVIEPAANAAPPVAGETAGNAAIRSSIVNGTQKVRVGRTGSDTDIPATPLEASPEAAIPEGAPLATPATSPAIIAPKMPIIKTPEIDPFQDDGLVIRPVANSPAMKARIAPPVEEAIPGEPTRINPGDTLPYLSPEGTIGAPGRRVMIVNGKPMAFNADPMAPEEAALPRATVTDPKLLKGLQKAANPLTDADRQKVIENAWSNREPRKLSLSDHLDTIANAAADRFHENTRGKLNTGIDPASLRDASIWLGTKIVKGLVDGTNYTRTLMQHFGEAIGPHAAKIWQQAKDVARWYHGDEAGAVDWGKIFAKDVGHEEKPPKSIEDTMGLFQRGRFGLQGGPFRSTGAFSEPAAQALVQRGSSREVIDAIHEYAMRQITGKGSKNPLTPDQIDLLGRYFSDQRARDYDAAKQKHTIPYLTAEELSQVQSEPALQKALTTYREGIGKWIAQTRMDTSPGMKLRGVPDFLSMIAKKDAKGNIVDEPQGPLGASGRPIRVGASRFAQEANGNAREWNHGFEDRLRASIADAVNQQSKHNVIKELLNARDKDGNPLAHINAAITEGPNGRARLASGKESERIPLPQTIKWNGKEYQARELNANIQIEKADGTKASVKIAVPDIVARDFDRAQDPSFNMGKSTGAGTHETFEKFSSLITGVTLASPSEAVNHIVSLISEAAAIPNIRASLGARGLHALVPFVSAAHKIFKLDGADHAFHNDVIHLSKIGAGSTRAFQHAVDSIQSKIPVLKQVGQMSAYQHRLLFGIPNGAGLGDLLRNGGFDIKLRVMLLREFRVMRPNATDAEARAFINQFGQYGSVKDPSVNLARYVHPFAATSLPKIATALRLLVGDSGYQHLTPKERLTVAAHMAVNQTLATIYTHYALNYALSGHPPTENADGHKFDIDLGNGKYVPFRITNPTQSRAMNTLGLRETAEDALAGNFSVGKTLNNTGRGLYNEGMQQLSNPGVQAASTALIGKYPGYITRGGNILTTAPDPKDAKSRAIAALAGTNDMTHNIMEYFVKQGGH